MICPPIQSARLLDGRLRLWVEVGDETLEATLPVESSEADLMHAMTTMRAVLETMP